MRLRSLARVERTWALLALDTVYPAVEDAGLPRGVAAMGLPAFLDDYCQRMPLLSILAFRAGVVLVALAPPFVMGRRCTIAGLSSEEREELLTRMAASSVYLFRQIIFLLKVTGSFLYGADVAVRSRMLAADGAPLAPAESLRRRPPPADAA